MKRETSIQWSTNFVICVPKFSFLTVIFEDKPFTCTLALILFSTSETLLYDRSLHYLEYSTNKMDSIH